ncbi:hypothetical protein [Peribacillus frigoritolerans]|uniref:hypothetical protein n=1 Tax=Peribacillus frigoritolerans TaxID=450367 RepID=UPI001F4F9AB8|nr:hypothetical protein [Peribacillus frigoritolerans]MCK2020505.1 hypothetical protein [Peribacillus frigoritolerans]
MRLYVAYYEFPKINGRRIPKGTKYYLTVDVEDTEDENRLLADVYAAVSKGTSVSKDCLKIAGWEELK